jgi:hypothetical protein
MEEFKSLDQLTKMDPRYALNNGNDSVLSLQKMHQVLAEETLNNHVADQIKDQFNIIKNMALYSFFCHSLTAEVQFKCYSLIEYALKLKIQPKKPMMLKALLEHALNQSWISDSGFRHIQQASSDNQGCKLMINQIPSLRSLNELGSNVQMSNDASLNILRFAVILLINYLLKQAIHTPRKLI